MCMGTANITKSAFLLLVSTMYIQKQKGCENWGRGGGWEILHCRPPITQDFF